MTQDPTATIAAHLSTCRFADLPASARRATRRDVLDTLGAALGGSAAPGIPEMLGLAREWGGRPEATALLTGLRLPAPQAAMLNAAMAHALDFDDTLDDAGSIHPGASVLAAGLAVAERRGGVPGEEFLLAVTLGLDLSCRIASAATLDRGWHRTALMGIFGATATAGRLLGLDAGRMQHALGIAYSQAAGNRQAILDAALTKRLQAGQAASSAVLAALLAERGFTGAQEVFAGGHGFYPMYQPEGTDLARLTAGLGVTWQHERLSFKPYPCGRPLHAALDAALALRNRLGLDAAGAAAAQVTITTGPAGYGDQFTPESPWRRPRQVVQAQFSLPFLVAAALVHGRVGIGEVAGVEDATVLALAARIGGAIDPAAPKGWARIALRRADGTEAAQETEAPLGSPDRPLTDAQLAAKFRDCAAHAARPIAAEAMDRAIAAVGALEQLPDVASLPRLFG